MDFDTKASSIILVIFQMKLKFQQLYIYACLNEKPHPNVFFVKSHEWNFSYGIKMVQSTHIQYMIKYFIKCCIYLNHLKYIFALCSILKHVFFPTNVLFNHLISIKKCNFFWKLNYLIVELPYFEYNLWKLILMLAWWKLKVTQFWKTIVVRTCFGHHNVLSPFVQKVHILLQKVCYKWSLYNQSTLINYKWA